MAVIPTRRPLRMRLLARWRCVLLRWLIRHAEHDLRHHQFELQRALDHLPAQIDVDRAHIADLTKRLTRETHGI